MEEEKNIMEQKQELEFIIIVRRFYVKQKKILKKNLKLLQKDIKEMIVIVK